MSKKKTSKEDKPLDPNLVDVKNTDVAPLVPNAPDLGVNISGFFEEKFKETVVNEGAKVDIDAPDNREEEDIEEVKKEETSIEKETLPEEVAKPKVVFSKEFPRAVFSGNTVLFQRSMVEEAGSHLLGQGTWKVVTETNGDGVTTAKVIEG